MAAIITQAGPKHPAKFSQDVVGVFSEWLGTDDLVFDPFAGVGTWHRNGLVCNEIELEWLQQCEGIKVQGDATRLPFRDNSFRKSCTSPTFGNRMADHHNPREDSERNTYRHKLGRPLSRQNTGMHHWGPVYWDMHRQAWKELHRVLVPGGVFAIHLSDFLVLGIRQPVVAWHVKTLNEIGFRLDKVRILPKKGLRYGANHEKRVEKEFVGLFSVVK